MLDSVKKTEKPAFLQDFCDFAKHNRGLSDVTIEKYAQMLTRLADFAGVSDLSKVTSEQLLGFTGLYLHNEGLTHRSRRAYVAAIRVFYRWLSDKAGSPNIAQNLPYPKLGRQLPLFIQTSHLESLLVNEGIDTYRGLRNTFMIYLMACGLRVGALVRLNEDDLLFEKDSLSVRIHTKGGVEAIIPMPKEVWVIARAYLGVLQQQGWDRNTRNGKKVLFCATNRWQTPAHDFHGEKRRIRAETVYLTLQRHGKRLGIPREQLHPHALRHSFGLALAKADISTLTRMKLMAHRSPEASAIYDHMSMNEAKTAMDKANPFKDMINPGGQLLLKLKEKKPKP